MTLMSRGASAVPARAWSLEGDDDAPQAANSDATKMSIVAEMTDCVAEGSRPAGRRWVEVPGISVEGIARSDGALHVLPDGASPTITGGASRIEVRGRSDAARAGCSA